MTTTGKSSTPGASTDPGILATAARAAELVKDGARVGLGSGRASSAFITALGARMRRGLSIVGVPTSEAAAKLARSLGIPLVEIEEDVPLDITVDGADEVAPNLDLVKGRGAAFVRERIVAAASRRQVILVGPEKLVPVLCGRGDGFPVEVFPLARGLAMRRLKALGLKPIERTDGRGGAFISDNGNLIFEVGVAKPLTDHAAARALEAAVLDIPGVLDTGLFLGTAERVLVGHPDGNVDVLTRTET